MRVANQFGAGPSAVVLQMIAPEGSSDGDDPRNDGGVDESILVEVFQEFLQTNHWNLRSTSDLLEYAARITRKQFGVYVHAGIPYLSTLFMVDSVWQGKLQAWLNIKLNTNGFIFQRLATQSRLARHNDDRWVRLGHAKETKYDGILSQFPPHFSYKIYYNEHVKKVEIKLFSNSVDAPCVLISFEQGFPAMDEGPDGARSRIAKDA